MWFERFVIIVTSLHRAFLPGEWHMFHPTAVDICIFVGSIGVFLHLFLLFLRFLPIFAMAELKAVLPQASPHYHEPMSSEPAPSTAPTSGPISTSTESSKGGH
jgi:molybdopterin-containing oxidoreductase family membrane subunit